MREISVDVKFCESCMMEHDIKTVETQEDEIYKDEIIQFTSTYEYCDETNEYVETEELKAVNLHAKNEAYEYKLSSN